MTLPHQTTLARFTFLLSCALLLCLFALFLTPSHGGIVLSRSKPTVSVLLVGITRYADQQIPRLEGPEMDVKELAQAFTSSQGKLANNVIVLIDKHATREEVLTQLSVLRAKKDDFLVLYWAGHSVYDPVSDDVYLLPSDSSLSPSPDRQSQDTQVQAGSALRIANAISLEHDIAPSSSEEEPFLFIGDGCNIGDALVGRLSRQYPYFGALTSTKPDENALDVLPGSHMSPFASILRDALRGEAEDLDGDGLISAEEIHHYIYPRMFALLRRSVVPISQHATIAGRNIHRLFLVKAVPKEAISQFILDDGLLQTLTDNDLKVSQINGQNVDTSRFDREYKVLFLSENANSLLQQGLNVVQAGRRRLLLWREKNKLKEFIIPYKKSRAIIIAIDDYDRVGDEFRRGPTGFTSLGSMVKNAGRLKDTLLPLGFDKDAIFTLYNQQATSSAIESLLREFWEGGKYADTDRLFFYFGGHGMIHGHEGLLVTYDYDPKRPTLTTLHLSDLTGRHAANIAANHVLGALEACYSGLALPRSLDDISGTVDPSAELATLSLIQADASKKARNFLVAGTDDERALYINGGIFTESLISALRGEADTDRNGVIQFDELALYVRNRVTIRARQTGVSQSPSTLILDIYGKGRILFLLPGLESPQ